MRCRHAIAVLCLSAIRASALGDVPADEPAREAATALDAILADWEAREARFAPGEFFVYAVRRSRSASFGFSPGEAAPRPRPEELVRVSFGTSAFRLDGLSEPSAGLERRAAEAKVSAAGGAADRELFMEALRSRFAGPVHRGADMMTYGALLDVEREVHWWDAVRTDAPRSTGAASANSSRLTGDEGLRYPRAIVFAPGAGEIVLGLDSLSSVPIYSGLLDAVRVAVRPLFGAPESARGAVDRNQASGGGAAATGGNRFQRAHARSAWRDRFRILPGRPVVDGRPCVTLEERAAHGWDGETRRMWVDPARESAVVRWMRFVGGKFAGPQYDIEYDPADEAGLGAARDRDASRSDSGIAGSRPAGSMALPRRITVLRMSSLGDPLDVLTVVRRAPVAGPARPASGTEATPSGDMEAGLHNNRGLNWLGFSPGRGATPREPPPRANETPPADSRAFDWQPAPGTWVEDFRRGVQYFVRVDGTERPISFRETYAGLTYADLVAEDSAGGAILKFDRRPVRGTMRLVQAALTWPGVLVTLPVTVAVLLVGRAGYQHRKKRRGV